MWSIWSPRGRLIGGCASQALVTVITPGGKNVKEERALLFHGFTAQGPLAPCHGAGTCRIYPQHSSLEADWAVAVGSGQEAKTRLPPTKYPRDLILEFPLPNNAASWSPSVQNARLWREFQYHNVTVTQETQGGVDMLRAGCARVLDFEA